MMFRTRVRAAILVCATVLMCVPGSTNPGIGGASLNSERSARADITIARYEALTKRLDELYRVLLSALSREPRLSLDLQPPPQVKHGYEILPRLVETHDHNDKSSRPGGYSWPWTDKLIDNALPQLTRLEAEIRELAALNGAARQRLFVALVQGYAELRSRIKNIDAHVQYNRFWQTEIAHDRTAYDRETARFYLVLQREAVRQLLSSLTPLQGRGQFNWAEGLPGAAVFADRLNDRAAMLTKKIDAATNLPQIPDFLRVQRRANGWIFKVTFYTDINDPEFVRSVKETIEKIWRAGRAGVNFAVELDFVLISPRDLYGAAAVSKPGSVLDLEHHLGFFPKDGAILTTGALTTHVNGRAIVLGPQDMDERVLAHEFGHILGFRDAYVRGYRNLGGNGFEILEAVVDGGDIMGRTDTGVVLPAHFEKLLQEMTRKTAVENVKEEGWSQRQRHADAGSFARHS